jgi:myo-inositol-1(or 4)-monophosphatase
MDDMEAVARAACLAGGEALRERFEADVLEGEFDVHDVKAAADAAAERRMLPVIRQAYPDHGVFAEEAGGFPGDADYRWVVDPLDGTNNFTAGLPTFASVVTLLHDGTAELAVVHLPMTRETYVARAGEGVTYDGEPVTAGSDLALATATVATVVGRAVPRDPDRAAVAEAVADAVGDRVKRVVESWAPAVHAGLFARGRLQGLVQLDPDEEEAAAAELLAAESGAAIRRDGPLMVAAGNEEKLDGIWTAVQDAATDRL